MLKIILNVLFLNSALKPEFAHFAFFDVLFWLSQWGRVQPVVKVAHRFKAILFSLHCQR